MPTNTNAKPATATKASKAKAAKPANAKPVTAAKPAAQPSEADAPKLAELRVAERIAARQAIADYYTGKSLPFKSASDRFAPLRTDKPAKAATTRQAALIAAMLICDNDIASDGTFTRGGFKFGGQSVQPETGCLSDMHGRVIQHVSGPLAGSEARNATFRINLDIAQSEISAMLGDKLAKPALAAIAKLRKAA